MTAQKLDRVVSSFRIGDPEGQFAIFDATGSTLYPGRWNTPTSPMLYTSEHYSTAMLEKLVHGGGLLPPNQHFVEIQIPPPLSYEIFDPASLPNWAAADPHTSQAFGEDWQASKRSLLLFVPSVVARRERNILINPEHADFPKVTHSLHEPVWWDSRLFSP